MTLPINISWDTTNANIAQPDAGHISIGWIPVEKPAVQHHNWLFQNGYLWRDWFLARIQADQPQTFNSVNIGWDGASVITLNNTLKNYFRNGAGVSYENDLPASTYSLSNGQILVYRQNRSASSPVTLTSGTQPLSIGKYTIINESALTLTNDQDQIILFRNNSGNLEIPVTGQVIYGAMNFNISGLPSDLVYADKTETITGAWTWGNVLNMGGFKINGLGTPAIGTDAATKAYVDAVLPSQGGNSGKFLQTNGSVVSWQSTPAGTLTGITAGANITVSGSAPSPTVAVSGLGSAAFQNTTAFDSAGSAAAAESAAISTSEGYTDTELAAINPQLAQFWAMFGLNGGISISWTWNLTSATYVPNGGSPYVEVTMSLSSSFAYYPVVGGCIRTFEPGHNAFNPDGYNICPANQMDNYFEFQIKDAGNNVYGDAMVSLAVFF